MFYGKGDVRQGSVKHIDGHIRSVRQIGDSSHQQLMIWDSEHRQDEAAV